MKSGKIISALWGLVFAVLWVSPVFSIGDNQDESQIGKLHRSGDWLYRERGSCASVCGYLGNEKHITVPSEVDGKKVLEISLMDDLDYGYYSFFMEEVKFSLVPGTGDSEGEKQELWAYIKRENPQTEGITLPDTVKKIKAYAFYDCISLKRAELPQGLEIIEESAFEGCENLERAELPPGLRRVGRCCFKGTAISSLTLPESLSYIEEEAFSCCDISSLVIPAGVRYMENNAFSDCLRLKAVSFSEGTERVNLLAFGSRSSFEEIHIPKSAKRIYLTGYEYFTKIYFAADREKTERAMSISDFHHLVSNAKNLYFGEEEELPAEGSPANTLKTVFMITGVGFSASFSAVLCLYIMERVKNRPKRDLSRGNVLAAFNGAGGTVCKKCGAECGENGKYCCSCGHKIKRG